MPTIKKNLLLTYSLLLLLLTLANMPTIQAQEAIESNNNTTDTPSLMTFSLEEAQAYAIQNNLNAQNNRLDIEAAKGQVKEVKAIGLPQVNASAGYQYNVKLPASLIPSGAFGLPPFFPVVNETGGVDTLLIAQPPADATQEFTELTFGTKHNISVGIDARQLLFDGSYTLGLKAAKLFVERARMEASQKDVDIKKSVADAYLASLVSKENVALLQRNIKVLNKVFYETGELYKSGFVEQLDLDRLEFSLLNLKTQANSAENLSILSQNLLKYQMGLDFNQAIELTDSLEGYVENAKELMETSVVDMQNDALSKRIELKLADIQNNFRALDVKQIKAKYLPNVVAFASGNTSFQGNNLKIFSSRWLPSLAVGLNVNIPIFDGFQKKGQLQQRLVTQQQAFKQEELIQQSVLLEVIQSQTNFVNAYQQVQSQKANLKLAEKIYNTTLIKYKEGIGSSLEVNSAETALYETQGKYIQALYDLVVTKTNIDKALGNY